MFVHELIENGQATDIAIIDGTRRLTYKDLCDSVAACRSRLYTAGLRSGDRAGIFSRNRAEYICSYLAIASLGAIAVPINFQLSLREIAYILQNADIHQLITDRPLQLTEALQAAGHTGDLTQHDITAIAQPAVLPAAPALPADFSADSPCAIIYTSGTTGVPKGAVLSHRNLTRNSEMLEQVLHIRPTDNVLCVLPMYHCFAWTCSVLNPLHSGAAITILPSFAPKETIDVIRTERVSVLYVVPSICSLLTKLAVPADLTSVRYVVIGGTTLPLQIAKNFTAKFGLNILEGYGLSEASPVVAVNPPSLVKVGSIGQPLPDVEIRIATANGQAAPLGESGELLVRGDLVMPGYWKLPEDTAAALQDGWLHTGDIARMDEDGYLYIVDRLKDMIISMGENIYPREIEELLYAYPGIQEAAVIGIDDKLRGQAGACFYSVHEGETLDIRALKKHLQQNLALYKIPREFHELPALPRTTTGKIAKREILAVYQAQKAARRKQ